MLVLLYVANAVVAFGAMGGLYVVWNSASLPFRANSDAGRVSRVTMSPEAGEFGLAGGDTILMIDGQPVHREDEVLFLLNARRSGSTITLTTSSLVMGHSMTRPIPLVHTYTTLNLIVRGFAGLTYLIFGLLILIRRPNEMTARIVNAVAMAAAIIVIDTWGYYGTPTIGVIYRCLFFFAYGLVPPLLLHFGLIFPMRLLKDNKWIVLPLYVVTIGLGICQSLLFAQAAHSGSVADYDVFASAYGVSEWLFGAITLAAFATFCISYYRSTEESERKKIRWVLLGISFSSLFYFFFEELPQMFGTPFLVSEDIMLLTSTVAPVTFAIAIIRYHVLDIDALLNRATVYLAVGAAAFALYAVLLIVATALIGQNSPAGNLALSSGAAILTALVFEPLRQSVQRFVDKTFFRVRYNYREAQKQILAKFSEVRTAEDLARLLIDNVDRLLKTEWSSVVLFRRSLMDGRSSTDEGSRTEEGDESLSSEMESVSIKDGPFVLSIGNSPEGADFRELLASALRLPFEVAAGAMPQGKPSDVEPGAHYTPFQESSGWPLDPSTTQPSLLIALLSEHGDTLGALALGPKRSGQRLSIEDVDLVESVARSAGLAIERSLLSERLVEEQAEARRQKQLNALKSQFVSSVSHDLKTPITSIKLFVQLLEQTQATLSSAELEYLRIIDGESDRLKTLIDNVLDHARIERGVMEYHLAPADLNACVRASLGPLKYLIDMQGFSLSVVLSEEQLPIEVDISAIHISLTNILSNAIKYGSGRGISRDGRAKEIVVRTFHDDGSPDGFGLGPPLSTPCACVEISDSGNGISERDLARVFEPFFRSNDQSKTLKAPGTGLGLANVKHAIEAHHGSITILSSPGKGTKVLIQLPLLVGRQDVVI